MENSIKNKVIVITGASSGLGEATAKHLAVMGGIVVLGARRADKLNEIVSIITLGGGTAIYQVTDVTRKNDVQALVNKAFATYGRVDVMINNAGIMPIAPMSEVRTDEWDNMIDINIKGCCMELLLLCLFFKNNDRVILSMWAQWPVLRCLVRAALCTAVPNLPCAISEGLRHEVGGDIRTTTIEPGAVDSELKFSTSHKESATNVTEFYKQAISADAVNRAIAYAIEQPADVDINEIVLRPTMQEF